LDNVTHSLAGMLLAEAVCVWRGETRRPVRTAAYLVSALANNLPDIDVLYAWIPEPRPLGNLLNHRGHTHTLLVGLPCAWLLGVGIWRWFLRRNPANASARERRLLVGLALAGVVLHLCMDFGNNYGVHPFWPLSGRWLYGDTVFIVEPLWLAVAIPVLAETLSRRSLKLTLWVVLSAVLVFCWFMPFVATPVRFVLLGLTALSAFVARKTRARFRIQFAVSACLSVALVFALGSMRAKANLRAATTAAFPALDVQDIATTPLPANPACWEGLVAGEQGGTYRVLRATVALAPVDALKCNAGMDVEPSAKVARLERANHGGVRWVSEYRADVAQLSRLRHDDCRFRAFLQFARLPYVSASGLIAGDLRYDRNPGRDFSDIALPHDPSKGICPRFVPGWQEPRAKLFQQ
jgi:inner membrane protein